MSVKSAIEWTDATWSPLRARVKADAGPIAEAKGYTSLVKIATKMAGHVGPHCERVSHGCDHCYSDTNNGRCLPANGTGLPFDRRARDLVDSFVDEKILMQPLKWRTPKKVFFENQSDLFGEWVTDEQIDRVFAVMALCPQHIFQVLTKRPERMLSYLSRGPLRVGEFSKQIHSQVRPFALPSESIFDGRRVARGEPWSIHEWPLPNVWLGVSCESQATADARIPLLLQTQAVIRFVSYEPALGPVDFTRIEFRRATWYNALEDHDGWGLLGAAHRKLDWVIVGGESGPGARPFDIAWARTTIEQCRTAGVACFLKQIGAKPVDSSVELHAWPLGVTGGTKPDGWEEGGDLVGPWFPCIMDRKGGDWLEWPDDLRVRQFPASTRGVA